MGCGLPIPDLDGLRGQLSPLLENTAHNCSVRNPPHHTCPRGPPGRSLVRMLNLLQNSKSPPHRTPRTLGPGLPRSCSVMRTFPMPSQHGLRGSGAHGSPLFHLKPWRNQRRPQQTEAKARRAPWDTWPLKRPTRVPKPKMRTVLPPALFLLGWQVCGPSLMASAPHCGSL